MLKVPQTFIDAFNRYVAQKQHFIFLIDFEGQKPLLFRTDEALKKGILFQTPNYQNFQTAEKQSIQYQKPEAHPIDFETYQSVFDTVQAHLQNGDTYLLNLTFKTPIDIEGQLEDIYHTAQAPYKFLLPDHFVCYSPETFIKTQGNHIFTFPMKGTIDASLPNALQQVLSDKKETFEHYTIVDLLRNDLSMVARNIQVDKFRYTDRIQNPSGDLLQISSQISGTLPDNWKDNAAGMFLKLLPAGSISGAPKPKTLEIIQNLEKGNRGYYTGIFGYFDGENFDSAVLIRYIEQQDAQYYYRSGGGITTLSHAENEYNEFIQKIYVPTH